MFSSRLDWETQPNPLSRLLSARRDAGSPILDLTESNPTAAEFHYPVGMLGPLANPRSLRYEPSCAGLPQAREAISAYYASRGFPVQPERLLLTASTSEAYSFLFKLLTDPGDEILVPRPSYPLFEFLAKLESVRPVQYPLYYHHGWGVDFERLDPLWTERTRAVILVNPNNPTGSYLKRGELDRWAAVCAERGAALISDEVFSDYAFEGDRERAATVATETRALAFALSGLSKICGLPQMKLGWIVLAGPPGLRSAAQERLELIADTFLSVGSPVQHGLPALLESGLLVRRQIAERTQANLNWLRAAVAGSNCGLLSVEGGWYATLRVPGVLPEEEWAMELLDRDGVLVQPGFFYDFESEAFLVVSLLTIPDVFREGIQRLLARAAAV